MKCLIVFCVLIAATMACKDLFNSCSRYAKRYCTPKSWMSRNCQRYCGHCSGEGDCKDEYAECSRYDKERYCSHSFLKSNCKKYCGYCSGGPKTPAPPTQPPRTEPPQTAEPPVPGQCGKSPVQQSRVVGGVTAKPGAWPWQIGMKFRGRFSCGGSLVNSKWIVTAAHCVDRRSEKDFQVTLGDHNRNVREGVEQTFNVKRIVRHPSYQRPSPINNDIALMELASPVKFTARVQPVCLPAKGEKPAVGSKCYITGWGKMSHPGTSTHILQQLGMLVQTNSDCHKLNGKYLPVTDKMVCATNPGATSNQSGCHGDSGGPFVCQQTDGTWKLHGAVSWGSPKCDMKDSYTVFARVAEFRDWIDQYIN